VKFTDAIELYVRDMWSQGRFSSAATERSYRAVLYAHAEDISNRDLRYVGREDIKRTLRRWPYPNTQRVRRAALVGFYKWAMEEGYRRDNPVEQTRRPKVRPPDKYRPTRSEALAMLQAATSQRECWAMTLLICAGLRNAEVRGLQGRHFARENILWVSSDIAKGARERWLPVIPELATVADEIRSLVGPEEYVLPALRFADPPFNTKRKVLKTTPSSSQALRKLVMDVAQRAGISAHIHPHLLRHAFTGHVARQAGVYTAQHLLGHATLATTELYLGKPTLDELSAAVADVRYGDDSRTDVLGGPQEPETADKAPTRIELVYTALQAAA
jgi:integrase